MKIFEQWRSTLPKVLSRCRITRAKDGSGDLLSYSPMHVGTREGADDKDGATTGRGENPNLD